MPLYLYLCGWRKDRFCALLECNGIRDGPMLLIHHYSRMYQLIWDMLYTKQSSLEDSDKEKGEAQQEWRQEYLVKNRKRKLSQHAYITPNADNRLDPFHMLQPLHHNSSLLVEEPLSSQASSTQRTVRLTLVIAHVDFDNRTDRRKPTHSAPG